MERLGTPPSHLQHFEPIASHVRHYRLRCQGCSATFEDDGAMLNCSVPHDPALLTTEYDANHVEPDERAPGMRRYRTWLPIVRDLPCSVKTVTYQSDWLSALTGVRNLWVAFSGYWPARGATLETATFKELEVYPVLVRLADLRSSVLVVASAGNTAAAFANICSRLHQPCLILIPSSGLSRMQFPEPLAPCVKIVSLVGFTDYQDAIALAERVARLDGFVLHGGARNIAVRDGLGTVMLNATETMGRLPDYYFQAIGSGTGAVAAHEAAKRLIADGRFGQTLPRLMLSQNVPFAPMYRAWKARRRALMTLHPDDGKKQIRQIVAQVLSNQRPAYSIAGGVFDVLTESRGDMLIADNGAVLRAMALFDASEGIDLDPAAGVALASLLAVAASGGLDREAVVLLHLTGGGWYQHAADHRLMPAKPALEIDQHETMVSDTPERIARLVR